MQVWSLGTSPARWYRNFARSLTQEPLGSLADWQEDHVKLIFQQKGHGPNWLKRREEESGDLQAFSEAGKIRVLVPDIAVPC